MRDDFLLKLREAVKNPCRRTANAFAHQMREYQIKCGSCGENEWERTQATWRCVCGEEEKSAK